MVYHVMEDSKVRKSELLISAIILINLKSAVVSEKNQEACPQKARHKRVHSVWLPFAWCCGIHLQLLKLHLYNISQRIIGFHRIVFFMLLKLIYMDFYSFHYWIHQNYFSEYKCFVLNYFLLTGISCSDLRIYLEYVVRSFSLVIKLKSQESIATLRCSSMKYFKLQSWLY